MKKTEMNSPMEIREWYIRLRRDRIIRTIGDAVEVAIAMAAVVGGCWWMWRLVAAAMG